MSEHGSESENPVLPSPTPTRRRPSTNLDWWPNQLNLQVLHQHSPRANPMGEDFDYAEEFKTLDVEALKRDLLDVMTTSQDWWPADYGHYGPLFIRMSWHSAGTYRIEDGRGGAGDGAQRFAPLNSWPDNANLDKARRLLWPVKQKYGRKISWADLLVLAGNVALESMGFKTFGFGFGREDIWEPEEIFWGPEDTWLGDERYSGDRELTGPFGAVQMGLIYVNPEGPNGKPDPLAAARDIRGDLPADGDERRGDGRADRGRPHVRQDARCGRPQPGRPRARGLPRRAPGPRLEEHLRQRQGQGHDHQWPRGCVDAHPDHVGQQLLRDPVRVRVGAHREPCRRQAVETEGRRRGGRGARRPRPLGQARPDDGDDGPLDAPRPGLRADLEAFHGEPGPARGGVRQGVVQAVAPRHGTRLAIPRPVGPGAAAVAGPRAPGRPRAGRWTGTSPPSRARSSSRGCPSPSWSPPRGRRPQLPRHRQAWRGERGADPSRAATELGGQRAGRAGHGAADPRADPAGLQRLPVRRDQGLACGPDRPGRVRGVEQAAKNAGHDVTVPFVPGRTDASQEQTDVESFAVLEPKADGFRNYLRAGEKLPPETLLLDRANLLTLTAPEMTVLVGGMRALGANVGRTRHGVLTDRPETLTNDFFVNLLDMGTEWKASASAENVFDGRDRATDEVTWSATAVDLVFGSNSQLRAIAEVYAGGDAQEKFVRDFVAAWVKVMNLDRFDIA